MVFWPILALMAAVSVGLVLRPLLGGRRAGADRNSYAAAVYRDQLASLETEQAGGLIGEVEAKAIRAEVGRRLLAIEKATASAPVLDAGHDRSRSHRWLAIVMLAVLPLGSIAIYFGVGSPGVSSVPYQARFEQNPKTATLENLVAQIERHLRTNPGDAKGWDIIGRPFMRLGRYRDAANAFDQAIKLDRPTAARLASYGEALVFAANGMVEAKARAAFEQSVALEADYTQARYYLGLAAFQSRDFESAIATWQAMLDGPGSKQGPWRKEVTDQVALAKRLQAEDTGSAEPPVAGAAPGTGQVATAPPPPGPTAQDVEAAQSMTPEQQRNLIESMVARLATRLESKGDDIDGWVRLLRAYGVLGKADEAKAALQRAREIFTGDPENLERLRGIVPET